MVAESLQTNNIKTSIDEDEVDNAEETEKGRKRKKHKMRRNSGGKTYLMFITASNRLVFRGSISLFDSAQACAWQRLGGYAANCRHQWKKGGDFLRTKSN